MTGWEPVLRRTLPAVALAASGILLTALTLPAQAAAIPTVEASSAHVTSAASVAAVSLTSFSPRRGPMGTTVTILGSGFRRTTRVAFHGVPATFTVVSASRITAVVPCGTSSGPLTVRTPTGAARSARTFTIP
jgi:hypothetical protein